MGVGLLCLVNSLTWVSTAARFGRGLQISTFCQLTDAFSPHVLVIILVTNGNHSLCVHSSLFVFWLRSRQIYESMFSEVAPFPQNSNLEFGLRTDVGNDDQSGGLVKSSTLWQSSLMKIIIRVYFH